MSTPYITRYEQEMQALRQSILHMGGVVEEMLGTVVEALANHDAEMARRVISMDHKVDALEKEIDELCLRLLALHHPVASDLRFVTMSMKLVTDLERMGDLVGNIAERIIDLTPSARLGPRVDLPRMARLAKEMIHRALDAFVSRDVVLAKDVMESDSEVDDLHWSIHRHLIEVMSRDRATVTRGVQLLLITKYLERLGDHATNISEEVIFLVEGRDVRHL